VSLSAGARKVAGRLSTKDADEDLAQLFLASVLGVPVTVHDRRSGHSTYDLEIHYTDGRRGAAEVVSTRTQTQAAQTDAVRRVGYTSRLLALQIKSGEWYFAEEADGGWWYRGKNRHLRYWLGHVLPVLIVIYDPASRTLYWQHVTEDLVEYTDREWKILTPRDQVLQAEVAGQLR
jgi:hypothetical protein